MIFCAKSNRYTLVIFVVTWVAAISFLIHRHGAASEVMLFDIKSGAVEYHVVGSSSGKEIMYWDDWGRKQSRFSELTFLQNNQINVQQIISLDEIVSINLETNIARRKPNPNGRLLSQMTPEEQQTGGESLLKFRGNQLVAGETDTIAGKRCQVWRHSQSDARTCLWKGIILSVHTKVGESELTLTATEVTVGLVDSSLFRIPSGIDVDD